MNVPPHNTHHHHQNNTHSDAGTRGHVASAARVVAGLTLLSRVFGLIRDAVCSRVFGAGPVWSAFAFAFLLPNLARRLFGEGALTGAFIPEYTRLLRDEPDAARRYAGAMLVLTSAVTLAATLAGELILVALYLFSPMGETGPLALTLAMLLLPFAPLICVTALIGGVLQTHGRFGPTAAAPVLLNLGIIAAVLLWRTIDGSDLESAAFTAGVGVLLAGALQILWSLAAARRHHPWSFDFSGVRPAVGRTLRRTGPVVLGLGALQINTLLDGVIASWPVLVGPTITLPFAGTVAYPLDEASNATLFFATRLYQFPLGVFGIALATAVFPTLARQVNDPAAFTSTLREGLRLSLYIGLPATVGILLVSRDLTEVVFSGGLFDDASVRRVSYVLGAYAFAVWAYTANHTLTRAYYAVGDTTTPMRLTLTLVAVNLTLNAALIWPLGEAGLAVSTAVCSVLQFVALLVFWTRRGLGPLAFDPAVLRSFLWTLGLTAVMAASVVGAQIATDATGLTAEGWGGRLARLVGAVTVGAVVFLGLSLAARRPEPRWLATRRGPAAAAG